VRLVEQQDHLKVLVRLTEALEFKAFEFKAPQL
jgi:hypothetical protein